MKLTIVLACFIGFSAVIAEEINQPDPFSASSAIDQEPSEQYYGYNPYGYSVYNGANQYGYGGYTPMYNSIYNSMIGYRGLPYRMRARRSVADEKETTNPASAQDQKAEANILPGWGYNSGLYNGLGGLAGNRGLAGYGGVVPAAYGGVVPAAYGGVVPPTYGGVVPAAYGGILPGAYTGAVPAAYNGIAAPVTTGLYQSVPHLAAYSYSYSHY